MRNEILSQYRLAEQIYSIYRYAKEQKLTSQQVRDRLRSVNEELATRTPKGRARYSNSIKAFISGYEWANNDHTMKNEVEFCYILKDGLYSTWKDTIHKRVNTLYGTERVKELYNCPNGFFWKGTNKHYTEVN
jgi:hypothetical protein